MKDQLSQRDAAIAQLRASLVATQLERDDGAQRLAEKDRELAQSKHSFRMHIRRLEVGERR